MVDELITPTGEQGPPIEMSDLGLSVTGVMDDFNRRIDEATRQVSYLQGAGGLLEPLSNVAGYNQVGLNTVDPTLMVASVEGVTFVGQAQLLLAGDGITFDRPANSPYLRISDDGGNVCIDYVVAGDGTGTHLTLASAMAAAITAQTDATIFICENISEKDIECGGMADTQIITILSWHDRWVTINHTNGDLFTQTSGGAGGSGGDEAGIFFKDIGIKNTDNTKSVYFLDGGTTIEIRNLWFDHVHFSGAYLIRNNDSLDQLGNMILTIENCTGALRGFFQNEGSTTLDQLWARNNDLAMNHWWKEEAADTPGTDPTNAPDLTYIQGGFYTITNGIIIEAAGNHDRWQFSDFILKSGFAGECFTHAAADTNHSGVHFSNITLVASNGDTNFGDFQGPSSNVQDNLYIVGIHGVTTSGVSPGGTFLTVDSDITNVYVADIHAPEWSTVYAGPTITPSVPPVVDHIIDADGNTSVHVETNADENIIRITANGTEMMTIADHGVDLHLTAAENDVHALEFEVDAAGFGDVKAIDISYDTGALATGEEEGIILVNLNEVDATGGEVFGLIVLSTDGAADAIYGLGVGAVVGPIHQNSGTFANPTTATNDTPGPADVNDMKDGSTGTNTTIFVLDDDYILIGAAAAFTEIEFIIETGAPQPGIKPTWGYSTTGAHQFTTFSPIDGTNGFRNTGVVSWEAEDLTGHVANSDTGTFDIKVTRTANNAGSVSLFYAKTATTVVYKWDKAGDVSIRALTIGIDDTTPGVLTIYGDTTSSVVGGELRLHTAADHDGTFQYWGVDVTSDDLRFFSSDNAVINIMTAEGQLTLPTTGSGAGLLIGGDVLLYRGATNRLDLGTGDSLRTTDGSISLTGTTGGLVENTQSPGMKLAAWGTTNGIGIQTSLMEFITANVGTDYRWGYGDSGSLTAVMFLDSGTGTLSIDKIDELTNGAGVTINDKLLLPITGSGAGILIGGEGPIYRGAVDTLDVGIDGTAPSFILHAQDGTDEGGQLELLGAASHTDWNLDNYQGRIRGHHGGTEYFSVNAAGQLGLPISGSSAGFLAGADALWYRSAANMWRTPDSVTIDANLLADDILERTAGDGIEIDSVIAHDSAIYAELGGRSHGLNARVNLTVTGGNQTDYERVLALEGDGRPAPDNSFGLWEATTNLISNGGVQTNTTGWVNSGGTISRVGVDLFKFGAVGAKIITDNAGANEGAYHAFTGAAATEYTVSVWVMSLEGGTANVVLWDDVSGRQASTAVTMTPVFQRISVTATTGGGAATFRAYIDTDTQQDIDFYFDGMQVEAKGFATPYVETDGGTASRTVGTCLLPSSVMDESQGWVAFRVRAGIASADMDSSAALFHWRNGTPLIILGVNTTSWLIQSRATSGVDSVTVAGTFAVGDFITVIAYWTTANIALSVDGSAFSTSSRADGVPDLVGDTTIDLLSRVGANQADMDCMWMVAGKGTITDTDARLLYALKNTPPNLNVLPVACHASVVWNGSTTAQTTGAPTETASL